VDEPINKAFIKQFEREVHEAYQRQGSKLWNTVRNISNVNGSSAVFQIVGKGTASISPNAGTVPLMNLSHSIVECVLSESRTPWPSPDSAARKPKLSRMKPVEQADDI
jgi:hypothetical protein